MRERIAASLKDAMRSKDQTRLATLRLMMAALKDREIAEREDGGDADSDAVAIAVLSRMVKQRQESIKAYEEGGRLELAAREMAEIEVIRDFLPEPLTEAETEAAVAEAVSEAQAESLKDMGKVMAILKDRYQGRMDFGAAGPKVKAALHEGLLRG